MLKQRNFIILACILISGCGKIADKIKSKVDKQCGVNIDANCNIKLAEITNFKWDKVYLFRKLTPSDSISKSINLRYSDASVNQENIRLLFLYRDKIVYQEDILMNYEYDGAIEFPRNASNKFFTSHYLTPATAVFSVEKDKTEFGEKDDFNYELTVVRK